ncbi:hypothetical protein PTKIN_Ptkin04bG0127500 [Pterospermum kingtungense]
MSGTNGCCEMMRKSIRKTCMACVRSFDVQIVRERNQGPFYRFIQESTSAPAVSYYNYIVVGGGTAGCPLPATLSESANVLVLERGGSPLSQPRLMISQTYPIQLELSHCDNLIIILGWFNYFSSYGVYNHRARVLGGGSVFNAGFYSHAETYFVKETGLDEALVNDSYKWVEKKVAFKPPVLQWQSAVRDGLLAAGVLPYNGFTYDHINGTKMGATIFDKDGHRHSAADLLEYADPEKIEIYLHATVLKIMLTTDQIEPSLVSFVGITRFGNYFEAGSGLNLASSWVQLLSKYLVTILNQKNVNTRSSEFGGDASLEPEAKTS